MKDALSLFEKGRYRGAMYMAGYSVECRIKVKLMNCFRVLTLDGLQSKLQRRLPDPELKLRIHDLNQLGMLLPRWELVCQDRHFRRSWSDVGLWSVAWRYEQEVLDKSVAEKFLGSVQEVLKCIENRF